MNSFAFLEVGDPERHALDAIQAHIAQTLSAISETEHAPLLAVEMRAKLVSRLQEAADRWSIGGQFGDFSMPDHREGRIPQTLSWVDLAGLFGVAKLADMIMAKVVIHQAPGLPYKERAAKLVELRALLDRAETAEEVEVMRLSAAGHTVIRREEIRLEEIVWPLWGKEAAGPSPSPAPATAKQASAARKS